MPANFGTGEAQCRSIPITDQTSNGNPNSIRRHNLSNNRFDDQDSLMFEITDISAFVSRLTANCKEMVDNRSEMRGMRKPGSEVQVSTTWVQRLGKTRLFFILSLCLNIPICFLLLATCSIRKWTLLFCSGDMPLYSGKQAVVRI